MITLAHASAPTLHTGPSLLKRIHLAMNTYKQRRALAKLTTAELADIGLTPAQAQAECRRPLWDIPHYH